MKEPNLEQDRKPVHEANKIRLSRDVYSGSYLLLEGNSDKLVFKNFIHTDECRIIIPPIGKSAKEYIIDTVEILNQDADFTGALAIVDNDFWVLEDYIIDKDNLLSTDYADLETMLICSPALNKVLDEIGNEEKQTRFVQNYKNIQEYLLEETAKIGYLRWYNNLTGLNLKFKGMDFKRFTDKDTLNISINDLVKVVKNNSGKPHISETSIIQEMEKLYNPDHQNFHICCGHDLVAFLTLGSRKIWGTNDSNSFKEEIIDVMLRLAYEYQYFITTNLYALITNWEVQNYPYKIMKLEA